MAARRPAGSYDTPEEAEAAVGRLAAAGLPVERSAIVACELAIVPARTRVLRAGRDGALQGALLGGVFGLAFGLIGAVERQVAGGVLALEGLVLGAILGGLLGLLVGAVRARSDPPEVRPGRFEVLVDEGMAGDAERVLSGPGRSG